MGWQRRLWTGLVGLLLAELVVGAVPFGYTKLWAGPGLANSWTAFLYVAAIFGLPALVGWALLCLPLLILRGKTPRPRDAAKLAGLGFLLGAAGVLLLDVLVVLIEMANGHNQGLLNTHPLLPAVYSGIVCALAMFLYVKLSVRQTLRDLRAAAAQAIAR